MTKSTNLSPLSGNRTQSDGTIIIEELNTWLIPLLLTLILISMWI